MLTAVALMLLLLDEAETIAPRLLRPGSPVVAGEAAGFTQKDSGFTQKNSGFAQKDSGFTQKNSGFA
ncbi:hypothetical protein T484DRAFT_1799011 [Baffinella frigidus]|nr:hypothetical protein T484DRAFT_1799011 [Cryptophyta sp. CCMP2293]